MKRMREGLPRIFNWIKLILCLFLIVSNIAVFVLVPGIMSAISVLASNFITIIIVIIARKPLSAILKDELRSKEDDIVREHQDRLNRDKELEEYKKRVAELEDQVSTFEQVGYMVGSVNLTSKLICMEDVKAGYIVKEIDLDKLPTDVTELDSWQRFRLGQNYNKALYIHKFNNKVQIILDFQQIEFAQDGDKMLLYGANIKEGDTVNQAEDEKGNIDRFLLLAEKKGQIVSVKDIAYEADYKQFASSFEAQQKKEYKTSVAAEVKQLSENATIKMQSLIEERFQGKVQFVDEKKKGLEWHYLSNTQDRRAVTVGAMLSFLSPNAINQAQLELAEKSE